jgi:hypothetical protein
MRWSLIEEDKVQTLGLGLPKVPKEDCKAIRIEAGELPLEGLPCGRLHGGREPVIFIQGLDDLARLHVIARQPTVQAQAPFVLTKDPHGLVRGLAA